MKYKSVADCDSTFWGTVQMPITLDCFATLAKTTDNVGCFTSFAKTTDNVDCFTSFAKTIKNARKDDDNKII